MATGRVQRAPVHPLAWAGIVTAVVAGALALYGSMHAEKHLWGSPLREARRPTELPAGSGPWAERKWAEVETRAFGGSIDAKLLEATRNSKIANYSLQIVAFVLPFVLGVGAGLTGGSAMNAIERSGGTRGGNTLAVFSMLIGGLAAVVSGCMMVSLYLWPRLPSLYTS